MVDRRKLLSYELGVGPGLVPTYPVNRKVVSSRRIIAHFPGGGARPARLIAQLRHGLLPGKYTALFDKGVPPIVALLIPAAIEKFLELPVRDFILVDEIIFQLDGRLIPKCETPARHPYHSRWHVTFRVQNKSDRQRRTCGTLDRLISFLGYPPPKITDRQSSVFDRRLAEKLPIPLDISISFHVHVGCRRSRLNRYRGGKITP